MPGPVSGDDASRLGVLLTALWSTTVGSVLLGTAALRWLMPADRAGVFVVLWGVGVVPSAVTTLLLVTNARLTDDGHRG